MRLQVAERGSASANHNTNPKPFIWTKNAREIPRKVFLANLRLSSKQNETLHSPYTETDLSPLADLPALGIELLSVPPSNTQAWQRYGLGIGVDAALVLVRPDGYVMGRWSGVDGTAMRQAITASGVWA